MTENKNDNTADLVAEITKLRTELEALITATKQKKTQQPARRTTSGHQCEALLRHNPYTNHTEKCQHLLQAGCLCAGPHTEYIKYNEKGQEEYREWSN